MSPIRLFRITLCLVLFATAILKGLWTLRMGTAFKPPLQPSPTKADNRYLVNRKIVQNVLEAQKGIQKRWSKKVLIATTENDYQNTKILIWRYIFDTCFPKPTFWNPTLLLNYFINVLLLLKKYKYYKFLEGINFT